MGDSDGEGDFVNNLFSQDDSFEAAPEIALKWDKYKRVKDCLSVEGPSQLNLALISKHHSLWAEFVYNAARVLSDRIDSGLIIATEKRCLELGAGAGLPGLVCALNNASAVVISDYGHDADLSLIYAIDINLKSIANYVSSTTTIQNSFGVGYIWGNPVDVLTNPAKAYQKVDTMSIDTQSYDSYFSSKISARIYHEATKEPLSIPEEDKFDIILLADLLFNRSEHLKLLWTIKQTLRRDGGVCHVTFSHHDPAKKLLDLNFFTLATEPTFNFQVTFIGQESRKSYPFVESDGLDEERGVVYIYTLQCK